MTALPKEYAAVLKMLVDPVDLPIAGRASTVYAIGLPFQRTRKSSFIDGVGADARLLAGHIAARLGQRAERIPSHDLTHDSIVTV